MEQLSVAQQNFVADAFLEHGNLIKQVARKFANGDTRYEVTDIESYLNEKFVKIAVKYDPTKTAKGLGAYLNAVLTKHAINFTNSAEAGVVKITKTFSALNDSADGEDKPLYEETKLTDGTFFEQDLHKQAYVSETLETLFAGATPLQRDIMNAYLNTEGKASYTEIGKKVGKHHETVKRELAKLAKLANFDFTMLADKQVDVQPRQRS